MLWPAFCTIATWVVIFVGGALRNGLDAADIGSLVAWILIGVPITVVVACTLLGGTAVLVALAVRAVMRVLAPTAPRWVQALVVAVLTGVGVAVAVLIFMAWIGVEETAVADYWRLAVGIGAVAVIASAIYSRDLFDKRHLVGWRREGQ